MRGILFFLTTNGQFTSHYNNNKFGTDYGGNICYIHWTLHERGALCSLLTEITLVRRKMLELKSEMYKWSTSSVIAVDIDSKNQHF
jgi:hypothetical protein